MSKIMRLILSKTGGMIANNWAELLLSARYLIRNGIGRNVISAEINTLWSLRMSTLTISWLKAVPPCSRYCIDNSYDDNGDANGNSL